MIESIRLTDTMVHQQLCNCALHCKPNTTPVDTALTPIPFFGCFAVQALTTSLEAVKEHTPATQAARQRLLQLVRCVIESEAISSSIAPFSPGATAGGSKLPVTHCNL